MAEMGAPIGNRDDLGRLGADVLIQFTQAKFAAQGIPLHMVASIAGSVGSTFIPAGVEASTGVMTAGWERSPADAAGYMDTATPT